MTSLFTGRATDSNWLRLHPALAGIMATIAVAALAPCAIAQHEHVHPPVHDDAPDRHVMPGLYGPQPMTRESSGTSWQPQSAPHDAFHFAGAGWDWMLHGAAQVVATRQDGPRGGDDFYSNNMVMLQGRRAVARGTLGLRLMASLEPATIGAEGYRLLLQTGETADGVHPLIDRQHPHDLFMELAAAYSLQLGEASSAFLYFGLPGEPALGPPAFMHRFSGLEIPAAPILHHWLDSTHIVFGVVTGGWTHRALKIDASAFRGREPDEERWNIEEPEFDSFSGRITLNPGANWSLQASGGWIESPEQLEPDVDMRRFTASITYHRPCARGHWQSLLAWGRNDKSPGPTLDGVLLESTARVLDRHVVMGRAELVRKDELFDEETFALLAHEAFLVGKVDGGYLYDVVASERLRLGLGALGSLTLVPDDLESSYGDTTLFSATALVRVTLR